MSKGPAAVSHAEVEIQPQRPAPLSPAYLPLRPATKAPRHPTNIGLPAPQGQDAGSHVEVNIIQQGPASPFPPHPRPSSITLDFLLILLHALSTHTARGPTASKGPAAEAHAKVEIPPHRPALPTAVHAGRATNPTDKGPPAPQGPTAGSEVEILRQGPPYFPLLHPSPLHQDLRLPLDFLLVLLPPYQPTRPEVRTCQKVLRLGAMPMSRSNRSAPLSLTLLHAGRALNLRTKVCLLSEVLLLGAMPRSRSYGKACLTSPWPSGRLLPRLYVHLIIVITTVGKASVCFPPCGLS